MNKQFLATSGCAVVLACALSACGGGGGGAGRMPAPPISTTPAPAPAPAPTPTPTPTPTPPPTPTPTPTPTPGSTNYNTAEYQASNGAVSAQAISAYDAGATGQGIKVGVIDSGINPALSEFAGQIDPASRDVAGNRGLGDDGGHGTAVSAVIAADKNNSGMHGVAFDSKIVMMRADAPGSCLDTSTDGGCSFNDSAIATGVNAAVAAGVKVINMSLGGSPPSGQLMNALQNAVQHGVILVISAGNDGQDAALGNNADPFALVPAQTFPGQVIIAGALASGSNTIASFSNRAGSGANWYLMALGSSVLTIDQNGTPSRWSGTSFSAPVISGAVALMAQAFPNLRAQQIVDILFSTADDLGPTGVDATYGHGRLNLARAFQPVGGSSLAGSGTPVTASSLPPAAGDGGSQSGSSLGAIILDGYDRAFVIDFAKTLEKAQQEHQLTRALQGGTKFAGGTAGPISVAMTVAEPRDIRLAYDVSRLGIGPEDARTARLVAGSAVARLDPKTAAAFGISESAKTLERRLSGAEAGAFLVAKDIAGNPGFSASHGSSMAVRREVRKFGLTMSGETGEVWTEARTRASGAPYRWTSVAVDRNLGRTWLSAGLSRLDEKQSVLGGRMSEALGGGGSNSTFLDVEARRQLGGGFSAGLTARRGWTDFAGGKFETAAYGFDLTKLGVLNGSDRLGIRVSQPLRVTSGGFNLFLPTSYDYLTGTATNSWQHFGMSPSGREIDTELSYSTSLLDGKAWLGGNLFLRKDPGHIANADADVGAAVRFSLGF